MVAVVTGKGAGVENASLSVLGAGGQFGSARVGRSGESAYVDAATGNLILTTVDEMLLGRGPDAVVSRTYNSQGAWDGDNADQWRASLYRRVTGLTGTYGAAASTVKRTDWDGSEVTYTWDAAYTDGTVTGAYVATDGGGSYDILTRASTTWTWVDGDTRMTEAYDDNFSGRITGRTDASGNAIGFTYASPSGLLTRVTAGSEYTDLSYTGNNLTYLETHTTSPTATTTRTYYEYDVTNRLIAVKVNLTPSDNSKTTGSNYTTTYTYDGTSKRVASVTQSDGTAVRFLYTLISGVYRVTTVTQTIAPSTAAILNGANTTVTQLADGTYRITKTGGASAWDADARGTARADGDFAVKLRAGQTNAYLVGGVSANPATNSSYTNINYGVHFNEYGDAYAMESGTYFSLGTTYTTSDNFWVVRTGTTIDYYKGATLESAMASGSLRTTSGASGSYYFDSSLVSGVLDGALVQQRTTTFSYDTTNRITTVTDELGQATRFAYDANGNLLTLTMPPSGTQDPAPVIGYTYQADGDVATMTAAGNTVTYDYDNHGNRILERDSLGNTVTRTFGTKNQLLTETRWTTPDPDGAGSGTPSGAMTTRYAYDSANRLRFVVDGEGRVTEYGYDTWGQQTAVIVYAATLYSLSGLSDSTSITENALASWVGGVADRTNAQRTHVGYDFRGNVANSTSYSKLLSNGDFDTSSDRSFVSYVYDGHGELLSKYVEGTGLTEIYAYDGLSRITSKSEKLDGANLMASPGSTSSWTAISTTSLSLSGTLTGYSPITVSAPVAGVTAAIFSAVTPVVSGDTLTYTVVLGAGTTSTAIVALTGTTSWMGTSGGATATIVSGPGSVSPSSGTSFQVTGLTGAPTVLSITRTFTQTENARAIIYAGAVASQAAGTSLLFANSTLTRATTTTTQTYTYTDASTGSTDTVTLANGLVKTTVTNKAGDLLTYAESGSGVTTTTTNYVYDKLGRLRVVAEPTIAGSPSVTESGRRRSYVFYDNDGRKVADVDPDGSLVEYRYDAAGRLTSSTAYATKITASWLTPGSSGIIDSSGVPRSVVLADIRPSSSVDDRWSWSFYDSSGRAIRSIDGTGAVTAFAYDGASRLTSTTEYANSLSAAAITALKAAATGANFYTNQHVEAFWSLANSDLDPAGTIGGVNAFELEATANATSLASSTGQQAAVVAGDTLSFTVQLKAGVSTSTTASVGLRATTTVFGNAADSSVAIVSGPGTVSRITGSVFLVTGLSTSDVTIIRVTRTFTQSESVWSTVYVGSASAGTTIGKTILFADPVLTRSPSLPALPTADSSNDRVNRNFYDNAGRLIGVLDAEGFVSKIEYDSAGRKVHSIARKNAPSTPTGSFATIFASASATNSADIHHWWLYDARGMLRAEVDGEGSVTRYDYSAAGYLTRQERGQKIDVSTPFSTPPTLATLAAAGGGEILSVTSWTRNAWGQALTETVTLTGSVTATTAYTYDTMHNLVTTTTQLGGTDPRTYRQEYDKQGRLLREMSGIGNATLGSNPSPTDLTTAYNAYGWNYAYDAAGRLKAKTGPGGTAMAWYFYNDDGALAYEVNAPGEVVEYLYNALGDRSDVILHAGRISTSGYSATTATSTVASAVTALADSALTSFTHLTFDVNGRVATSTDALSNVTTFSYNAFGELASTSAPLDNDGAGGTARTIVTDRTYDRRGLLKQEKADPAGKNLITTYGYDAFGRAITLTNALSKVTTSTYDRKGRLATTMVSPNGSTNYTTTYTYDARDNLVAVTDALGNKTRYVYDKANRRIAVIDALGALTTTIYDADGRVVETRAYNNQVSLTGLPNEIVENNSTFTAALANTNAIDHVTRYAYDKDGQLRFTVNAFGHAVEQVYDKRGNVIRTVAYDGTITPSSYSATDIATAVSSLASAAGTRTTRAVYDTADRVNYTIDAIGQLTWHVYDAKGQLTKKVELAAAYTTSGDQTLATMDSWRTTNANATNDRTTRAWYDRKGQLAYSIDAMGYVTKFEYDKLGTVRKQTAYAAGPALTISDSTTLAQLVADTYLSSSPSTRRVTQFTYDSAGRLETTIDPEGFVTKLVLDAMGQITSSTQAFGVSGQASTTAYVYDDLGRVLKQTLANGEAEASSSWFFYDALGQNVATVDGDNYLSVRTYDAVGQVTAETRYGNAITTSFTSATAVATLQGYAGTSAIDSTTSRGYDSFGAVTSATDGRGSVVSSAYDSLGRLRTVTEQLEAGTTDDRVTTYTYDSFGNVVKTEDARGNSSFAYFDKLGRVVRHVDAEKLVTDTTYSRGSKIATVKRWANAVAGTVVETTVPGNPTTDAARDATTGFSYDKRDLLIQTTDALGAVESYTLNAFGERTEYRNKLHNTVVNSVTLNTTVTYAYDKRGLLLSETLPISTKTSGGSTISVVNAFSYDGRGNLLQKIEAQGAAEARTTSYGYDKLDRLTSTTHDAVDVVKEDLTTFTSFAPVETIAYDRRGNVIETSQTVGKANNNSTIVAKTWSYYDAYSRKIGEYSPTGTLSRFAYDKAGNLTSAKVYENSPSPAPTTGGGTAPAGTGNNRETTYSYDRSNRRTGSSSVSLQTGEWTGSVWAFTTAAITTAIEYDKNGNVLRETDGRGNSVYHWYDKLGRETARIDAENYLTRWERDAEGNATSETRYANKVTGSFTTATAESALTGLLGTGAVDANRVTSFTYDKMGRRLTEVRASVACTSINTTNGAATDSSASATITYTYNGLGQVLSKTEANGDATSYRYDETGRLVFETGQSFTDHGGGTVTPRTAYVYDGLGNLKSTRVQSDASGTNSNDRITSYTYGPGGRLATMTDAEGKQRVYGYDAAGRVVRDQYNRTNSAGSYIVEAQVTRYDLAGRAITQTLARYDGSAWVFTTGESGNPTNPFDAIRIRYNAYGEVSGRGITGGPAATAVYQEFFDYDAGGRMWRSNTGDGVLRFHIYDKAGNETLTLASTGGDLSALTVSNYTASIANNGTGDTGTPDAVTTVSVYDKRGQLLQTRETDRALASSSTSNLILRSKAYNAFGEVSSETDARGYATDFEYNTMGRLTRKVSPQVSVTAENGATSNVRPEERYGYDLSGRLVSVRDANSINLGTDYRTTRLLLAGTGHGGGEALVTKEFHPDTGVFETGYDVFGDVRKLTNEVGSIETRDYDKLGRLITQTHAGRGADTVGNTGAAVQLVDHYVYDELGQRTGHWNSQLGSSVVERTDYDAKGRIVTTIGFAGDTVTYSYAWNASLTTSGLADYDGWQKTTVRAGATVNMVEANDYFGRLIDKTDHGNHDYAFTFDLAGRLVSRSNGGGESVSYTWYNTGLAAGQTGTQGTATYAYDAAGNRTAESFVKSSVSYRNASASYDALGRMTAWSDSGHATAAPASETWEYDANGNVRRLAATYSTITSLGTVSGTGSQEYWFKFDTMNRQTIEKGYLDGSRGSGTILRGTGGVDITYHKDGARATILYNASVYGQGWQYVDGGGQLIVPDGTGNGSWHLNTFTFAGQRREDYSYTADGYLAAVHHADSYTDPGSEPLYDWATPETVYYMTPPAWHNLTADYDRDAMGRVIWNKEWGGIAGSSERTGITYDNAGRTLSETTVTYRQDYPGGPHATFTTYITNSYTNGLLTQQYQDAWKNGSDSSAPDSRQTYSYAWWDGALQSAISNDHDDDSGTTAWTTSYSFDASGHIVTAAIADGRPRQVHLAVDQNGMITSRDEELNTAGEDSGPRQLRYHFGGIQIGEAGNNGTDNLEYMASTRDRLTPSPTSPGLFRNGATGPTPFADFEQAYEAINGLSTASTSQSYTVDGGESLAAIAQAMWGDASLWYLIADANGLSGAETLAAGRTLTIPNKVRNNRNSADTWKPYDPNEALGDTSPTDAKPSKKGKCATLGMVMLVAIAVAVTIVVSAGATAAIAGKGFMAVLGMMTGGAAVSGISAGMMIAGAAIGGAVGSLASQGAGIAMGLQSSINWKGVAIAGITSAISAGLGQIGSGAAAARQAGVNAINGLKTGTFSAIARGFVSGAIRGAAANALTQGVASLTGLQKEFNPLSVALAGVSGGVSGAMGGAFPGANTVLERAGAGLVRSMAGGLANATAATLINGSDFDDNLMAALPDIIGSTLGDMMAGGVASMGKSKGTGKPVGPSAGAADEASTRQAAVDAVGETSVLYTITPEAQAMLARHKFDSNGDSDTEIVPSNTGSSDIGAGYDNRDREAFNLDGPTNSKPAVYLRWTHKYSTASEYDQSRFNLNSEIIDGFDVFSPMILGDVDEASIHSINQPVQRGVIRYANPYGPPGYRAWVNSLPAGPWLAVTRYNNVSRRIAWIRPWDSYEARNPTSIPNSRQLRAREDQLAKLEYEMAAHIVRHSYDKHVVRQSEFRGVNSRREFEGLVLGILRNPTYVKPLNNNRTAYWHSPSHTLIIVNQRMPAQSTAFKPRGKIQYFYGLE